MKPIVDKNLDLDVDDGFVAAAEDFAGGEAAENEGDRNKKARLHRMP
jgi:hypothetical protein